MRRRCLGCTVALWIGSLAMSFPEAGLCPRYVMLNSVLMPRGMRTVTMRIYAFNVL